MKCLSPLLLLSALALNGRSENSPSPLSWQQEELVLPSYTQEKKGMKPGKRGRLAMHNGGAWFPKKGSERIQQEDLRLNKITLQQGQFSVEILPGVASSIHRVIDADGMDWFYHEQRIKDWIPWWESGIKANFPFMEHGIREVQPSAWQVVQDAPDSLRYSSWMEFSRYHSIQESVQFGRHSNMLLEQDVRVRKGDPRLYVTYRVSNPSYLRQGLQVWNDAFWPRFHHPDGIAQGKTKLQYPDDAEILGAMDWASDHLGHHLKAFDPDIHNPRNTQKDNFSYFVWDVQEGWCGLYYPSVDVARLRLVDPEKAPGTKWWWRKSAVPSDVNHNFIEMWGGSDHVFEGVERWLGPGEQWEATWTYVNVQGIGKPVAANDHAVLAFKEGQVTAVSYKALEEAELWVNGSKAASGKISFTQPLRAEVEQLSHVELRRGDQVLIRTEVPRKPRPMREDIRQRIARSLDYDNPVSAEMQGNQHTRGRFYRNAKYPANSLGKARVLIRDGALQAANTQLNVLLEKEPELGEAWHLLGATLLEQELHPKAESALRQALRVEDPYPAAAYLLAILALAQENPDEARSHLETLLIQRPAHQEGKLLQAFLAADQNASEKLVNQHPADPRVRWVALQVAQRLSGEAGKHAQILDQLLQQEPGAAARVTEFEAVTQGRFLHPQRLDAQH